MFSLKEGISLNIFSLNELISFLKWLLFREQIQFSRMIILFVNKFMFFEFIFLTVNKFIFSLKLNKYNSLMLWCKK